MPRVYGHETIKEGDRFGRLTVAGPTIFKVRGRQCRTLKPCVCDCGKEVVKDIYAIKSGKTRSCGCLNSEASSARRHRHGMSRTRLHNEWCAIRQRCKNPNTLGYANYGGRGIRVCQEWDESFEAFRDWAMSNGYAHDLTIERKDVNGHYSPGNCCWIPAARQALNRRVNRMLTAFGETKPLEEWARDPRCKVSRAVFYNRIHKHGIPPEEAMSRPSERGPRKVRRITMLGETKTAKQWASDPRCVVTYNGFIARLNRGLPPEQALMTPRTDTRA